MPQKKKKEKNRIPSGSMGMLLYHIQQVAKPQTDLKGAYDRGLCSKFIL
jgi:hypothetical protein